MYKIYIIILTVIMIFSITACIFADEIEISNSESEYENEDDTNIGIPVETTIPLYADDSIVSYNVVRSVSPVSPSDTSGLKSALLSVLGNYDAVIVEYQYQSSNGYYSYLREVQPDYVWIFSAVLLIIVIFCLFRFLGGLFSGRC